ncbi:MAG: hypothetical protein IJN37_07000 [Clostridia bacterium]|nr:hypothetical protein [Clostridia bacterium]
MKLKRCLSLILCAVMIMSAMPVMAADSIHVVPINIMVGGKSFLPTDVNGKNVPVFAYNGTTYAPLRALAEAYGLEVGYNSEKNLATVGGTPSANFAGSRGTAQALTKATNLSVTPINIEVNGSVFQPKDVTGKNVPVFAYNGTTYAPLRALAEAYGLEVGYNGEKNMATVDFVDVDGIDFEKILKDVTAQRKAEFSTSPDYGTYKSFLVDDDTTKGLLTSAEVNALKNAGDKWVETVTYEQAAYDVDLLFRALHAGYGAYYYFGKDAYDNAEAEVMAWLNGKTNVDVDELTDVIRKSLDFMMDAHSYVGYRLDKLDGVRYEYHYNTSQQYDKDEKGYFKVVNGTRYDFVSFSDSRVKMEPALLENGKIVYSPVLFVPKNSVKNTAVTLKTAGGNITENIVWSSPARFESTGDVNYEYLEENKIAYISVASFQDRNNKAYYQQFSRTGGQVKDCNAIIFDLRSNGGGNGQPMYEWVQYFTGTFPQLREAGANRKSILNSSETKSVFEDIELKKGTWLKNNIPIIVLMNDACGSAGESALNLLKGMENVVVIGSNSAGYQLGGNCVDVHLPNTHIKASVGTQLRFMFELKGVDYKGYEPDVWCDPDKVLDGAFNLIVNEGYADDVTSLREDVKAVIAENAEKREEYKPSGTNSGISLQVGDMTVEAGSNFGASGTCNVTVLYKGKPLTDYDVFVKDTSIATAAKNADGTFTLSVKSEGETEIFIQNDEFSESFGLKGRKK